MNKYKLHRISNPEEFLNNAMTMQQYELCSLCPSVIIDGKIEQYLMVLKLKEEKK